jgi:hypothetical protein
MIDVKEHGKITCRYGYGAGALIVKPDHCSGVFSVTAAAFDPEDIIHIDSAFAVFEKSSVLDLSCADLAPGIVDKTGIRDLRKMYLVILVYHNAPVDTAEYLTLGLCLAPEIVAQSVQQTRDLILKAVQYDFRIVCGVYVDGL